MSAFVQQCPTVGVHVLLENCHFDMHLYSGNDILCWKLHFCNKMANVCVLLRLILHSICVLKMFTAFA